MSDVSSAIDKLSQLQNDSGTSNVENRFNEATEGLSVYTVNKIDSLKEEKNNLIQATVMNTISQCSNYYDMKGIKDNKTLKSIEQLGVIVVGAVVGAYCLYKGCEYTPKVYHYMDKPDVAVSFTLMRSSRDTKQLGVSKEGQSVLVTAIDYFDEPVNPAEAFPTVPKSRRKGLYGLYATNSTGWSVSNERKDKLKRKYDELRKSVI